MAQDNRYLMRQRQGFYVVVEVPPSLRKRLGRRIKRTLNTRDINVARARRWRALAQIKAQIEDIRKGREPDTIEQEAIAWREVLEAAERGEEPVVGLPNDEDQDGFVRSLIYDRVEQLEARKSTEAQAAAFGGIATGRATPLRLYVDQWLAEGALRGAPLKERTKAERRRAVDKLAEWMARTKIAATVEAVTRRVAGRYVSDELIPSGRDPVTLGKSVRSLTSYWAWLQKRGHLPEEARNPWSGQAPQKRSSDLDGIGSERAFKDIEVARLLTSPPSDTLADFMRVGALTGMRREEIGQLRIADCAGGTFIIQRGKTAAARRRVPIHSGLVDIVSRRSRGKPAAAFLFHELASKNAERTDPIGKLFTRYRRSLGIQDGEGRRSLVNFHSFRRWFVTSAINAHQPAHVVALVVGHKEGRKGMTLGRYWGGADDPILKACVEAVMLPDEVQSLQLVSS
jgi:integrase